MSNPATPRRTRAYSEASSGVLAELLRKNNVFLGGSSMGKGFRRAARYYLRKQAPTRIDHSIAYGEGTAFLNEGVDHRVEDPFLVVDMGMVVSQFYQWRKHFPRVEPFYALKCNPDPLLVKALAAMGCNFDCASREEIRLVQKVSEELPPPRNKPDIIYANPAKARSHIIEAVCRGVRLVTFDNVAEVKKCASVSKHIQLVLRIITDDSGSQCRLSSKFGAPRSRWSTLLAAAKQHGLEVVGVSFHVGSGCRDVTRYEMALRDAREVFDMAKNEYGFNMHILDIGGGFPGETHSLWNPATIFGDPTAPDSDLPFARRRKYTIDEEIDDDEAEDDMKEGFKPEDNEKQAYRPLMYFTEIADAVAPMLDELFPPDTGVRIIAEPGRYLVAAACTLVTSVISVRPNAVSEKVVPIHISDSEAAWNVDRMTRAEEDEIIEEQGKTEGHHRVITSIMDDLADYSKLFAQINLSQQEVDVYTDKLDMTFEDPSALLAPPHERGGDVDVCPHHTVEGMTMGIVSECLPDDLSVPESTAGTVTATALTLAAAGEAAVSGVLKQVIADAAGFEDDFAYYVNDGVYGSFNNLMFDHASVRPRHLKQAISKTHTIVERVRKDGVKILEAIEDSSDSSDDESKAADDALYPSTIFGPTCDSIDVIGRSVLLPKLSVGDWLYFQNMGAYTCAAASAFNGFVPTEKFYVCSIQPESFEKLIEGPGFEDEEKKDEQ